MLLLPWFTRWLKRSFKMFGGLKSKKGIKLIHYIHSEGKKKGPLPLVPVPNRYISYNWQKIEVDVLHFPPLFRSPMPILPSSTD